MTDAKNAKKCPKFMCEKCDFTCSKQSNYDKHLSTGKHEILTNTYTKNAEKCQTYICSCGKSYKYRQSLYSHKKKCNYIEEIKNEVVEVENAVVEVGTEESDRSLIIKLMNENMELHKTIKEIIPKIGNNNNTTNNNTTNNNTFNLNVFLNETCKDALNITDFIVLVSPVNAKPNLNKIECFKVSNGDGINFKSSVWHFPLISTEDTSFLVIDRKGSGDNLIIHNFDKDNIFLKY